MSGRGHRAAWTRYLSGGGRAAPAVQPNAARGLEGLVLGIDPSLRGTGLAVIEARRGAFQLVASETVKNGPKLDLPGCLVAISAAVERMIGAHGPGHCALERVISGKNVRTALLLGAARGAAIAAVGRAGLAIREYPPSRIKQAACGSGRASKEQVQGQVRALLGMSELLPTDEADAAATAICHALNGGAAPLG